MRTPIASLLALALVAAPLAGCGKPAPMGAPMMRSAAKAKAKGTDASATGLASRFAELMRPNFTGTLTVAGPVVTLTFEELATSYDFSATPQTGTVTVTSEDFSTEVPLDELMKGASLRAGGMTTEVLPVLLVPIATQVAIAAAKALAMYYITHHGEDFDKSDALKACVVAMGLSLIPFVGQLGTVGQFVPVAAKILAASGSFAYKDIAKAAIGMLDEIVPIVLALLKARKGAESH
jgi:predicted small lipoprotein YifL